MTELITNITYYLISELVPNITIYLISELVPNITNYLISEPVPDSLRESFLTYGWSECYRWSECYGWSSGSGDKGHITRKSLLLIAL